MQRILFFLLLIPVVISTPAFAKGHLAGSVEKIQGTASVMHAGKSMLLEKGMYIYTEDLITTGKDGAVGIRLQDNTIFSLGPETKLAIQEFTFVEEERKFSLLAKMIKGTFVYISGLIGKLSPESVQLDTPVGTIAVRGTRFAAKFAGE